MKKVYDNWRNEILNEFAPSYGIEDTEAGIEQYITPTSDVVQKTIQDAIDKSRGYHASGRPIDPKLLQGSLNENRLEDLVGVMRDDSSDYIRKISMSPKEIELALSRLQDMRKMYTQTKNSTKATIMVPETATVRFLTSIFVNEKEFQKYKESVIAASEAFGSILRSNKYELIVAVRLFTGASVPTVRNPTQFDASKAKEPLLSGGLSSREKRKVIRRLLSSDLNEESRTAFLSIVDHVYTMNSPTVRNGIFMATIPKSIEKMTQLFDYIIELYNKIKSTHDMDKADDPFLRKMSSMTVLRIKVAAEAIGYSTKSKQFKMLLKGFERIASMIPIYEKFFKHYVAFLGVPTKKMYENANKNMLALCNKKVKGDWTVYRGMYIKDGIDPSLIKEGMTFNFYDISSWSTSKSTARSFIQDNYDEPPESRLLFSLKPKRGTYIDEYSVFKGEEEFVTGGAVKITKTANLGGHALQYILIECEQL